MKFFNSAVHFPGQITADLFNYFNPFKYCAAQCASLVKFSHFCIILVLKKY